MASESFKEDLLRGCGSFVEKLGKGEVRRCLAVPGPDVCQAEGKLAEATGGPALCTESPGKGSCLLTEAGKCVPMRGCVDACMCLHSCAYMYMSVH